ncbi:unnamed protein product [Brachionus calyciflorus]|uniref:Tetraspanin n=1 Tax=Brachionus calyciflorus TaxID=104777 RepID=A0A814MUK6_9BILA|nr:unnamed protein product [Brachionus calyciflorus]
MVNIEFLLIGCADFIEAATIVNKIETNDVLKTIINVTTINNDNLIRLILSAFIIMLCIIGLCGACCANRFFLGVYEILMVILFISHGIGFVNELSGTVENEFKNSLYRIEFRQPLNEIVFDVNSNKTSEEDKIEKCSALKLISEIYECCGLNGPGDFINATYVTECCYGSSTYGCGDETVMSFKENGVNNIIILNSIELVLEFSIIIQVPFLIGYITKSRRRYEHVDHNERIDLIKRAK